MTYDPFPIFSGNDGVLIPGNLGMRKSGNPRCPGNGSPGMETLPGRLYVLILNVVL